MYGVSGHRIEQMYSELLSGNNIIIDNNTTDVVIYLGTNNIWQGQTPEQARDHMITLVDAIHRKKPSVKIHILKIFVAGDAPNHSGMRNLNNYYKQLYNNIPEQ